MELIFIALKERPSPGALRAPPSPRRGEGNDCRPPKLCIRRRDVHHQFDPLAVFADPSGGLSLRRRLCARRPHPVVAVAAARLACGGRDALVRLFLPRSATGHAEARRHSWFRRPTAPSAASVATVPPKELGLGERPLTRISVFMSVFDCHVNRSPRRGPHRADRLSAGQVPQRRSRQGQRDNERNMLVIATPGARASALSRSPAWWRGASSRSCARGEIVAAGQRFGMIRFGSRVDVYLPPGVPALVGEGQTAIAGETVLADLRAADAGARFQRRLTPSFQMRRCRRSRCSPPNVMASAAPQTLYCAMVFNRSVPTFAIGVCRRGSSGDSGAHAGAEPGHAARALRRASPASAWRSRTATGSRLRPSSSPRFWTASTAAWRGS